jgi:hypothetical protein
VDGKPAEASYHVIIEKKNNRGSESGPGHEVHEV